MGQEVPGSLYSALITTGIKQYSNVLIMIQIWLREAAKKNISFLNGSAIERGVGLSACH